MLGLIGSHTQVYSASLRAAYVEACAAWAGCCVWLRVGYVGARASCVACCIGCVTETCAAWAVCRMGCVMGHVLHLLCAAWASCWLWCSCVVLSAAGSHEPNTKDGHV